MYEVEVEDRGQRYVAEYAVFGGMITVYADVESLSTPMNGYPNEDKAARQLLLSLVRQGKVQPLRDTLEK